MESRGNRDCWIARHKENNLSDNMILKKSSRAKNGNNNIPRGSLGPGKSFGVETCHGIRLRVHTSWGLDTDHWES